MDIAVWGDEHFILGFQSAGVKHAFRAEQDVHRTFESIMQRDDIGLLIMENTAFERLPERLKERALTQVRPTVIVLSHDVSAEENLRLMIRRSLGIDVWNK